MAQSRKEALYDRIVRQANSMGFDGVEVVAASELSNRGPFDAWIAEGRQGEMGYMTRNSELRFDSSKLFAPARSALVLTTNYYQPDARLGAGLRVARYARGNDYHDELRARMKSLASFVHAEVGGEVQYRCFVDSAPLMERELASQGRLGWIGKNGMLIHPQRGSYSFLSEILMSVEIPAPSPEAVPDRCGTCSACIDLCPTNALISPYVLDARRCISYLTIEERGPIPRRLRPLMGDHVFGCDICQEVCPWNSRSAPSRQAEFRTRAVLDELSLAGLISLGVEAYQETFRRSPMKRAKRRGLLRNAAVAIGNSLDPGYLSLLDERLGLEGEPLVRGHIAWAVGRIGGEEAIRILTGAQIREGEPYVREEIETALRAQVEMN
jgi:epoxyqueuosine reductase